MSYQLNQSKLLNIGKITNKKDNNRIENLMRSEDEFQKINSNFLEDCQRLCVCRPGLY